MEDFREKLKGQVVDMLETMADYTIECYKESLAKYIVELKNEKLKDPNVDYTDGISDALDSVLYMLGRDEKGEPCPMNE